LYVNENIPVETVPEIGRGVYDKGEWWRGVNSSVIYLIYCKNIYKCHNVSPSSKTIEPSRTKKVEIHW
jgi:hypothetical protein